MAKDDALGTIIILAGVGLLAAYTGVLGKEAQCKVAQWFRADIQGCPAPGSGSTGSGSIGDGRSGKGSGTGSGSGSGNGGGGSGDGQSVPTCFGVTAVTTMPISYPCPCSIHCTGQGYVSATGNVYIFQQMVEWKNARALSSENYCDWEAFRAHLRGIGAPDPGPVPFTEFCGLQPDYAGDGGGYGLF